MAYDHWTKIDDGAEGAWAADVWFRTLEIIAEHEGERVYDENAPIYSHLEEEIPGLSWKSRESDSFRPYFRDFAKPWTITGTASFDEFFKLTSKGKMLVEGSLKLSDFWNSFLKSYSENNEKPFSELCAAFVLCDKSLSLSEIYFAVVKGFRKDHDVAIDLTANAGLEVPSVPRRRLALMLEFIERTGAIVKIGTGAKQRWRRWDVDLLKELADIKDKAIQQQLCSSQSLPKPFLLLAGISGTGKSRFVRKQAEQHQIGRANYCLVAVRPDWHEPSDLLGYVTRLSGSPVYVATDVLRFIVAAWKALHTAGLNIHGGYRDGEDALVTTYLSGSNEQMDAVAPYWLCLDEMNLAPVEQYFADYLSLIETRDWQQNGENFIYCCDAMLKAGVLGELNTIAQRELASALGLDGTAPGEADHALWQHFLAHGIAIPPNLIVAGTVNMDETTHGFSRKVIDRAMSFDFGEFFPNVFDDFYASETSHVTLTFPRHASGRQALAKDDAQPSIDFLQAVNGVLKGSPFELAYRALNELLLAVYCHGSPVPGPELQAVWDDFLMQKVLPRIEGDADKLQGKEDGNLLSRLRDLLENQLGDIWSEGRQRPDFYRLQANKPMQTNCRSRRKINWMLDRLASSGFTSFWP